MSEETSRHRLVLVAVALVAGLWLSTLQTQVGAHPDRLLDDNGEFVLAWHLWGVTHPPGYPLLAIVGNLSVRMLGLFGLSPLLAANIANLVWALVGVGLLGWLLGMHDAPGAGAAVAVLAVATVRVTWLYASAAEAYSFGLMLAAVCLLLAWTVGERPSAAVVLWLGVASGLMVGHHRTLLLLGPAMLLMVWPAVKVLGWRPFALGALLGVSTLLVYAYLPITTSLGSPWVYGRPPNTWAGFWDAAIAREYESQVFIRPALGELWAQLTERSARLAAGMSLPLVGAGAIGLVAGLWQPATRRLALAVGLLFLTFLLAPINNLLLIFSYMPLIIGATSLALGAGIGVAALWQWRVAAGVVGTVAVLAVAGYAAQQHYPQVADLTRNDYGRQLIDAAAALDAADATVIDSWSPRYFAFAYGKLASRETPDIALIDAQQDLAGVVAARDTLPATVFTSREMIAFYGLDAWADALGGPVYLQSGPYPLVAVSRTPETMPLPESLAGSAPPVVLVDGEARLDGDHVAMTLHWQATGAVPADYQVYVHLTDRDEIASHDDLIVQGDRLHPVDGLYPTSRWQPGELVRDAYRIALPDERIPTRVFVGLFSVDGGEFTQHSRYLIDVVQ